MKIAVCGGETGGVGRWDLRRGASLLRVVTASSPFFSPPSSLAVPRRSTCSPKQSVRTDSRRDGLGNPNAASEVTSFASFLAIRGFYISAHVTHDRFLRLVLIVPSTYLKGVGFWLYVKPTKTCRRAVTF